MSGKNSILGISEPEKCWISWYFYTDDLAEISMKKNDYNFVARFVQILGKTSLYTVPVKKPEHLQ